ncbi:MAG: MATE family efflux transporter, partial [Flavisolibacter sp.]
MLGQMLGDKAVGIYSVAVRISEVWYFIPAAIVASVFPSIIEARKQSETLYYQRLQKLYDMLVILAVMVAIPMTFISGWIILKLFGHSYQPAGPVLSIIIWSGVFAALSVSSGRWFINEGYVWMALKRNLFGALVNVGFNFYLIPLYGILGAAYSTLIAFMVSAYISDAFSSKTRVVFLQKTKSIFFINLLYALRNR